MEGKYILFTCFLGKSQENCQRQNPVKYVTKNKLWNLKDTKFSSTSHRRTSTIPAFYCCHVVEYVSLLATLIKPGESSSWHRWILVKIINFKIQPLFKLPSLMSCYLKELSVTIICYLIQNEHSFYHMTSKVYKAPSLQKMHQKFYPVRVSVFIILSRYHMNILHQKKKKEEKKIGKFFSLVWMQK